MIQAYESSIPFARDYVTRILPAVCGGMSVAGQKYRPDLTQGAWASANPKAQHSGGEVTFSCRRNGAEMRGQVVAETCIYPASANIGGAPWTVDLLAGYFAPPDRYAAAGALMEHVVKALRYNPDWIRQEQAKNEAALRGINAATEASSRIAQQALASAQRTITPPRSSRRRSTGASTAAPLCGFGRQPLPARQHQDAMDRPRRPDRRHRWRLAPSGLGAAQGSSARVGRIIAAWRPGPTTRGFIQKEQPAPTLPKMSRAGNASRRFPRPKVKS